MSWNTLGVTVLLDKTSISSWSIAVLTNELLLKPLMLVVIKTSPETKNTYKSVILWNFVDYIYFNTT